MNRSQIEVKLPWLSPKITRQTQGRRLKIYVERLDKNFYLINPFGRRLSLAAKFSLAQQGITLGWRKGAEVWPHDVLPLEIELMKLAQSRRFCQTIIAPVQCSPC